MEAQTILDLKEIAKRLGLSNYSSLDKKDLITLINKYTSQFSSKGKGRATPRPRGRPPSYEPRKPPSYESVKDDRPPNFYLPYIKIIEDVDKLIPYDNYLKVPEKVYLKTWNDLPNLIAKNNNSSNYTNKEWENYRREIMYALILLSHLDTTKHRIDRVKMYQFLRSYIHNYVSSGTKPSGKDFVYRRYSFTFRQTASAASKQIQAFDAKKAFYQDSWKKTIER